MKRRPQGEGSVYRSPDGAGWIASLDLPMEGNGRRRRRKRRAATKAEAQKLLREMRDELYRTGTIGSGQRTVRDAVDGYLTARSSDRISIGTRDQDRWLTQLIVEGLGNRRLNTLSVGDCDDFLTACAVGFGGHRGIGRPQMSKLRARLIAVLRNEMRTGQLGRNVAQLSILPGTEVQEGERRALTAAELQALIDVSRDSRLVLIDLCGRNALRPAEARGLRWLDLDLDSQELSVRGQQDRQNNRTEPKKAHNSARTIQLDKTTIDRLKAWREEQDDLRRRAGPAWQESGIVASTAFGTPVDRHSFARSMRLLCAKVGIDPPITPYELRHTAISMQADAGRSSWEIADWAGTSGGHGQPDLPPPAPACLYPASNPLASHRYTRPCSH